MSDFVKISSYKKINGEIKKIFLETDSSVVNYDDSKSVKDKLNELDNIIDTISGKFIHINNSSNSILNKNVIYGETKQISYTGKNLFNNTAETITQNGVTYKVYDDKTVEIFGISSVEILGVPMGTVILQPGEYILSGCPAGGGMNLYQMIIKIYESTPVIHYDTGNGTSFIITEEDTECEISIFTYSAAGTYTYKDLIFKPMVRLATIEDDTYEPYCGGVASPNPNYPQNIISVGDNGSLSQTICGKNLWNDTSRIPDDAYGVVKTSDGEYTVLSVASTTYAHASIVKQLKPNTTYTISTTGSGEGSVRGIVINNPEDNSPSNYRYGGITFPESEAFIKHTFTTDNIGLIRFIFYITGSESSGFIKFKNLQLEMGETATEYEPYKEIVCDISLTEPLRSLPNGIRDEIVYNEDRTGKIIRRIGVVILDGSENWRRNNPDVDGDYVYYCHKDTCGLFTINNTCYCDKLQVLSLSALITNPSYTNTSSIAIYNADYANYIYIKILNIEENTATSLQTWLSENPVIIQYELATPIEEELTIDQLNELRKLRTHYGISNIFTNNTLGELEVFYYNDTNTSEVIVKIKDKVDIIDDDLTNLTNDVDELELSSMAIGIAIGDSITVEDSTDAQVVELSIDGKSEQKSYTGKNLIDYENWSKIETINGTSVFENNGVTITAGDSGDAFTSYTNSMMFSEETYPVNEGDILTLSWESDSDLPGNVYIFGNATTSYAQRVCNDTSKSLTYTVPSGVTFISFRFGVVTAGNTISYKNIQLEKNSVATEYEPYVGGIASPNPDYPQEINSVADSGSIEVTTYGKNLIPLTVDYLKSINDNGTWSGNTYSLEGLIYTLNLNDKNNVESITINGTTTTGKAAFYCTTSLIPNTENKTLTMSGVGALTWAYLDGSWHGFETGTNSTIINTDSAGIIQMWISAPSIGASYDNVTIYPQLEIGTEATEYKPYVGSKANINLVEPLRSLPNGTKDELVFNADGTGKVIRRVGSVYLDGSSDEVWKSSSYDGSELMFWITYNSLGIPWGALSEFICDRFSYNSGKWYQAKIGQISQPTTVDDNRGFCFYLGDSLTLEDWIAWIKENPVTVQYEIETPYEESLTNEQLNALLSLKTYESITNVMTNDTLQPMLDMTYVKNTNIGKAISGFRSNLVTDTHAGLMSPEDKVKLDLDTLATAEASGQHLTITDASNSPFNDFGMDGKSTQKTLTGKNLLNVTGVSETQDGVTCTYNGDGTYTLNGTAGEVGGLFTIGYIDSSLIGETLKIVGCPPNGSAETYYFQVRAMAEQDFGEGKEFTVSDTLDNSVNPVRIAVANNTTLNNVLFKPMLTTDLNATYDDFEPYCGGIPSPNPDYPQEIESVANDGSVEVVTCGKNLLNVEDFTMEAGESETHKLQRIYNFNKIMKPNKTYTVSFYTNYTEEIWFSIYDMDTKNVSVFIGRTPNNGRLTLTFTTPTDLTNYYKLLVYAGKPTQTMGNIVDVRNFQIEYGDTATDYESYQETTQTLTLSNPLRSLPNGVCDELVLNADGSGKIVRNVGSVVFDGSDDESWVYSSNTMCINSIDSKQKLRGSAYSTHFSIRYVDMTDLTELNTFCLGNVTPIMFKTEITDVGEWKTWLSENNVTVNYELETPTEEELTTEQVAELLNLQTYENITNVYSNDNLQPNIRAGYYKNTNVGVACGNNRKLYNNILKIINNN